MDDINSYSIDVAMNISSNAAEEFTRFNNVANATMSLVKGIANQTSSALSQTATYLTDQFMSVGKELLGAYQNTTKVNDNLKETLQASTDINKAGIELNDMLQEVQENRDQTNDSLKLQNVLTKTLGDTTSGIGKVWQNLKGFAGEFAAELGIVGAAGIATGIAISGIKHAWQLLIDEEERFVTINYRVYGTQREILNQVNATTKQYGLLRGMALQAYQELAGSLRVPREELGMYIDSTVELNRVTGIGISQIGIWVRRMKLAGYDLIEVRRGVQGYEAAMHLAGATTAEVAALMNRQTDSMVVNVARWGKQAAQSMRELDLAVGAMARSHGADLDLMTKLNNSLSSNLVAQAVATQTGAAYAKQLGERAKAFDFLGKARDQELGKINLLIKASQVYDRTSNPSEQIVMFQALSNIYGVSADEIRNMGAQWKVMAANARDGGFVGDDIDLAIKAMSDFRKEMERTANYQEAMNTLAARYNSVVGYMQSLWVDVATLLAPLFMRMISGLELIAHAGSLVIDVLSGMARAAAILYAPFVLLYDVAVEFMIGVMDGIQAALGPFLSVVTKIYQAIFNQGPVWQDFAKVVRNVGYVVGVLLTPALVAAGAAAVALSAYFGLLPAAVTLMTTVFTGAIPALMALTTGLWSAAVAAVGFVAPFLPIIGIVAAVVTPLAAFAIYLYKTGAAMAFVTSMWEAFKEGIAPLWGALNELKSAFQPIVAAFKPVVDVIREMFNISGDEADSFNWIVPVMTTIGKTVGWVLSFAVMPLVWGIETLTGIVAGISKVVQLFTGEASIAGMALDYLKGFVLDLLSPFTLLWSVITSVIDVFGASGAGIIEEAGWAATALEFLALPVKMVTAVISSMGSVIGTVLSGFSGFTTAIGTVISSIGTVIAAPINAIGSASTMVSDAFGSMLDKLSAFIINTPGVSQAFVSIADSIGTFLAPLRMAASLLQKLPFIGNWFGGGDAATESPAQQTSPVEQVAQVGQDTYAALVDPVSSAVDTLWTMVPALSDVYAAMAEAVSIGVANISNQIDIPPINQKFDVEPIASVKVMDKGDTGTTPLVRERQQLHSVKLLEKMVEKLDKLKLDDNGELKDILAVLRQYLPNINSGERVAPDLSNWMG